MAGDVWVALPEEDTVSRVDDKTGSNVSIRVGRHPTEIAVRGRQSWVTSLIDHTLTRIDPKTRRTGGDPVPVALNPYARAVTDDSVWLTAAGAERRAPERRPLEVARPDDAGPQRLQREARALLVLRQVVDPERLEQRAQRALDRVDAHHELVSRSAGCSPAWRSRSP